MFTRVSEGSWLHLHEEPALFSAVTSSRSAKGGWGWRPVGTLWPGQLLTRGCSWNSYLQSSSGNGPSEVRPVHVSDILGPVRRGKARLSPGVLVSLGLVTASPTSVNFHVVLDADFFFSPCAWFFKMDSQPLGILLLPLSILGFQKNYRLRFLSKRKKKPGKMCHRPPWCWVRTVADHTTSSSGSWRLIDFWECLLFHLSAMLISHHKSTNKFVFVVITLESDWKDWASFPVERELRT